MKNFKLFLESKALEQLFLQEVIEGDVTLPHRIDNIKTKKITGRLTIQTTDYGDLRHIQVGSINIEPIDIVELNNLPTTLKNLDCFNNKITALDNLPTTLKNLDCFNNKITALDNLPQTLESLICFRNKITALDNLPQGLEILDCSYNDITALDNLPPTLKTLDFGYNKITSLSNLPPNLEKISYRNNPIHDLVIRYDSLGKKIPLAYLIQALELDSTIHTINDIKPIMDLIGNDYKMYTDIFIQSGVNLKTHTTEEIIEILSSL